MVLKFGYYKKNESYTTCRNKIFEICKRMCESRIRSDIIRTVLAIFSVHARFEECKSQWIDNAGSVEAKRLSNKIIVYAPEGER